MMNKCQWCEGKTDLPSSYYTMSPLQEKYELLLQDFQKKYGEQWWDSKEIDPKILDDVMFYDQLTNTVGKGVVCKDCLEKEDKIYTKFQKK